jgi:hypothetical protein
VAGDSASEGGKVWNSENWKSRPRECMSKSVPFQDSTHV